ncbi:MAG TPA: hypothetical protein VID47_10640, partial [Actinomycetota bacterium]
MSRARHGRVRSRSTGVVLGVIILLLVGGGALAAVRLFRSGGSGAAPATTAPATTAPATTGPAS